MKMGIFILFAKSAFTWRALSAAYVARCQIEVSRILATLLRTALMFYCERSLRARVVCFINWNSTFEFIDYSFHNFFLHVCSWVLSSEEESFHLEMDIHQPFLLNLTYVHQCFSFIILSSTFCFIRSHAVQV